MRIEPIIGIEKGNRILSEREFEHFSIFSTEEMIRSYLANYGYHFVGIYKENSELIVVRNCNRELEMFLGCPNLYQVINYKTGEVVVPALSRLEAIVNEFPKDLIGIVMTKAYRIDRKGGKASLIESSQSSPIIEADEMFFINHKSLFYSICGLEYIFDIEEQQVYPLLNQERVIYVGRDEDFTDMRTAIYATSQNNVHSFPLFSCNIQELIKKYPYGEKRGKLFHLLNGELHYGISYENEEKSHIHWYASEEDRNHLLTELGLTIEETLERPKTKKYVD